MTTFSNPQTSTSTSTRTKWNVDPTHSEIHFSGKHMMISTVRGKFQKFDVDLQIDENDLTNSYVKANIDADSLITNQDQRDGHLRSADFFDVANHPYITFESKRIEPAGGDEYKIYGDLTVRGTTKEVVLDTTFEGGGKYPWGGERKAFSAKTTINRKDFGLNWNVALETGGVLVSDNIKIEIDVEAVKPTEQAA